MALCNCRMMGGAVQCRRKRGRAEGGERRGEEGEEGENRMRDGGRTRACEGQRGAGEVEGQVKTDIMNIFSVCR